MRLLILFFSLLAPATQAAVFSCEPSAQTKEDNGESTAIVTLSSRELTFESFGEKNESVVPKTVFQPTHAKKSPAYKTRSKAISAEGITFAYPAREMLSGKESDLTITFEIKDEDTTENEYGAYHCRIK